MTETPLPLLSVDGARALVEYQTHHPTDPVDTPKPHIHPLRSPHGLVVTDRGPVDHPWHHGLQFAMPYVNADNLWGGGSYLDPDSGYVVIDNQGEIRHERWTDLTIGDGAAFASEEVVWLGHDGTSLVNEIRTMHVAPIMVGHLAAVQLDHRSLLTSATGSSVDLATPAQKGRTDGGYGGLFLRMAPSFELVDAESDEGVARGSGQEGTWFIVRARIEGKPVTFGFTDLRDSQVPRSRWLYRFEDFPAVGWAVAYIQGITLSADSPLLFAHRLVVVDGHATREDLVLALSN